MTSEAFISDVFPLKNKLFRYAKSILGNDDEAKDVVQETLIKVWEKRSDLHQYHSLEAWCMTIARNFALARFRRKENKNSALELVSDKLELSYTDDRQPEWNDTSSRIGDIVKQLPLKQKEVFQLRDIEGYTYQEICEITGYELSDVKVCIFRARKAIKERLTKIYDHEGTKSAFR